MHETNFVRSRPSPNCSWCCDGNLQVDAQTGSKEPCCTTGNATHTPPLKFYLTDADTDSVNKASMLLATAVVLLAAGLVMSFYGSQIITEGLNSVTGAVSPSQVVEIEAELDLQLGEEAVYVVQVMSPDDSQVSVTVLDPSGIQILAESVESDSHEGTFVIHTGGIYRLIVENTGTETEVAAVLGHIPDTGTFSVAITGFYMLLIGLVAMAALAVYVIKRRRRSQLR